MTLDHTTLSGYDCPRRGYYRHELHLVPLSVSPVLHAGICGHAALAEWYKDRDDIAAQTALLEAWGDDDSPPPGEYDYLTFDHLRSVVSGYFDHWRDTDPLHPILSETPLSLDALGYGGRIDMADDSAGYVRPVDHKYTTKTLGPWLQKEHKISSQLRGYILMLRECMENVAAEAVINWIYMGPSDKPHISMSDKIAGRQGIVRYHRDVFQFSPGHLEEERQNILARSQAIDYYRQEGVWPQHVSRACTFCDYFPLCDAAPLLREDRIKELYTVRRWDYAMP